MEKEKKQYNKILIVALIFGLLLVVVFFLNANSVSKNNENNSTSSVMNIKNIDDKQEKKDKQLNKEKEHIISYHFDKNDEEATVFSGLINYSEENDVEVEYNNDYDFGVFIESISGIKNGYDGKYWQYYIDDILGDVAADNKILKEEDNVEWRFEKVPF